jgi:peptide/nickel transport system substrate-binding protein
MAEAGHPSGIDVTIKVPANLVWQRAAEIMQAQFAESQIRMKIEVLEWAQWLDVVFRQKAYELSIVTQPDPWTLFNYTDPNYFYQYSNPKFLELAERADTAPIEAEFTSSMQAAQRQLAEDAASGWLFSLANVVVYKKELKGVWKDAPNRINEVARWTWAT